MHRTPLTGLLALAALLSLLLLSGCVTTTATRGADTYCQIARPITWADADTDETIEQVKSNNAVWNELCGKK